MLGRQSLPNERHSQHRVSLKRIYPTTDDCFGCLITDFGAGLEIDFDSSQTLSNTPEGLVTRNKLAQSHPYQRQFHDVSFRYPTGVFDRR